MTTGQSAAPTKGRDEWAVIAQFAFWAVSVTSAFVIPPPLGALQYGDSGTWSRASEFFVMLSSGLILIFTRRWRLPRHWIGWTIVAVVSAAVSVWLFVRYAEKSQEWSCQWGEERVVVGDVLTTEGADYTAKNPRLTCDELVWNHAGRVERVWTRTSVDNRRRTLGRLYLFAPLPAGAALMIIPHVWGLVSGKRRQNRSVRRP